MADPVRGPTLNDLDYSACRWVVEAAPEGQGDQSVMCGSPKREGSAYCAVHHAQAMSPRHPGRIKPPFVENLSAPRPSARAFSYAFRHGLKP